MTPVAKNALCTKCVIILLYFAEHGKFKGSAQPGASAWHQRRLFLLCNREHLAQIACKIDSIRPLALASRGLENCIGSASRLRNFATCPESSRSLAVA